VRHEAACRKLVHKLFVDAGPQGIVEVLERLDAGEVRYLHAHDSALKFLGIGRLGAQGVEEFEVRAADGGGVAQQAVEPRRYLPQLQFHQSLLHPGLDKLGHDAPPTTSA
jgi:hypothetical protein